MKIFLKFKKKLQCSFMNLILDSNFEKKIKYVTVLTIVGENLKYNSCKWLENAACNFQI